MKTLFLIIFCGVVCWGTSLAQTSPPLPNLPPSLTATDPVTLRRFVAAADTLKVRAERRIAALTGELTALDNALLAGKKLTAYDEVKRQQLLDELSICQGKLAEANRVINRCWEKLPRRYRNQAGLSLYDAVDQYEADLKRRGGRLGVIGVAVGFAAGFFLFH